MIFLFRSAEKRVKGKIRQIKMGFICESLLFTALTAVIIIHNSFGVHDSRLFFSLSLSLLTARADRVY
jgi:hypothetical protein